MTEKQKEEIIQVIEYQIQRAEKKIEELKEFTQPISPDNAIGRVSRMDAINNKSIYDASMQNTKALLKRLNQALKLKDDPNFGICTVCKKSIPFERLKIRPDIRFCVNCLNKS